MEHSVDWAFDAAILDCNWILDSTVEPRLNEVAGDRPNFVR